MGLPAMSKVMIGRFGREAVAALLQYSRSTSDPKIAAAFAAKAADIAARDAPPVSDGDMTPAAPDVGDQRLWTEADKLSQFWR
jgi:hypothetical protein